MSIKILTLNLILCSIATYGSSCYAAAFPEDSSAVTPPSSVHVGASAYIMSSEEAAELERLKADETQLDARRVILAYSMAGLKGHLRILQYLDNPERSGIHLDPAIVQTLVDEAYENAGFCGYVHILQYLDDPARTLHPSQSHVNSAYVYAAGNGEVGTMRYLDDPARALRPDQVTIMQAYLNALTYALRQPLYHQLVINYLAPCISFQERLAR